MNSYESLLARIRQVRRRWRSQVLVRGISLFLVSAVALLVLGVWGADLFGFKPAAVWTMRVLTAGTVLFVAWYFLYLPLRIRVDDVRVAQYIEERYPELEDRLVAAVEYGKMAPSSGIIDLLIKDALDRAVRVDPAAFLNRRRLLAFGAAGAAAFLALFALLNWGPSFFPYGFSHLYVPWTEASRGELMMIEITPGDIEVAKGSDQQVKAQLFGFDSSDVRLFVQAEGAEDWTSSAMEPDPRGSAFRYLLIDLRRPLRYYAESEGVKSRVHMLAVRDLATVEKMELTYNFPAYTGMAPQVVADEGDISGLQGTKIDFKLHLSRPSRAARLLFDNGSAVELTRSGPQDFTGAFTLSRSGSYVIQITDDRGGTHKGSPEYEVEAIEDAPPKVTISRPMRDVRATSVEEVFAEIKADDDIGTNRLELRYTVNGGPEKAVSLYGGRTAQPSVTGSHTFFLEEFGLVPGDVIAYYGKAWDNNNVTGPGVSSSDIYFIQIRPFEQKYRQSQQGAMSGGQGGEGQEALSKQQKEIISATFKVIREKERMPAQELQDNLKSLALVQSRLQGQAQGLVDRLRRRGAEQADETFRKLAEYLTNAIKEMEQAAVNLGARKPESAMPQEQRSLQQLMRAESLFREIQVSFSQNAGGSGSQSSAEDLADLFELELNKLKNQYETVQRGEQQARDQKVDEALEKLKELARRQQQLNERNRRMARQGSPSASAGGGASQGQQELMEEAEKLKRQLQRLSRERSSPQLSEAGSQIEKAIQEMKKALDSSKGNASESAAQGMRAQQQLDEAARRLARSQQSGLRERLDEAIGESQSLVDEQKRIQEGLERLARDRQRSGESGGNLSDRARDDLVARKSALSDRLKTLEEEIRNLSRQARKSQKEASDKLAEAAGTIQEKRLRERITGANSMIRNGNYEGGQQREDFIREGLESVSRQLESARSSIGQGREEKLEEAANRARQLAEGLESMQQRMDGAPLGQSGREQDRAGQQRGQSRANRPGESRQRSSDGPAQPDPNARPGSPGLDMDLRDRPSGDTAAGGAHRDETVRQLRREMQQRREDAEALRALLDRNSTEMRNLEKVIETLRRAGDYTGLDDPEQIARLRRAIELMREVELDLARDLDRLDQREKYLFAQDNEAPGDYQKLVDAYYRSLAETR